MVWDTQRPPAWGLGAGVTSGPDVPHWLSFCPREMSLAPCEGMPAGSLPETLFPPSLDGVAGQVMGGWV